MSYFLLDAFSITQYITSPYSLGAFAIAAVMTYFIRQNLNERKKIEAANPEDRATLVKTIAERIHINIDDLPPIKRVEIVKNIIRNRIITQTIIATVVILLGFFITFLVYTNIKSQENQAKPSTENPVKPSPTDSPGNKIEVIDNHGVIQQINGGNKTETGQIKDSLKK